MRTTPITVDEIMKWGPCADWPRERVAAYVGDGMTVPQFLAASGLTDEELDWLLNRREVLSVAELRRVLSEVKDREPQHGPPDFVLLSKWPDPNGALAYARQRKGPAPLVASLRGVVGVV